MATNLVVNGTTYAYPTAGDNPGWGAVAANWASAITSGMLSKAGGSFTLTAEVDFGATYGLKAAYFKSKTANISTTGVLRLANADGIGFRDSGNSADYLLKPSTDGLLQYNSVDLVNISSSQTLALKTLTSPVLNGTLSGTAFLDENDMASNSDIAVASQQSIKAYVDTTAASAALVRYTDTFDASADWGAAGGGYYTITITAATHGRGVTPVVQIEQDAGAGAYDVALVDKVNINASGDIAFRVLETPDCRFAGRIVIT